MAAVRVPDVLVRISPKMLEKYQSLAVAGAGRGRAAPLPYTFTRGSTLATRGFDGVGRKFAANKVAIEYPAGLVDADGNQVAGIRLNGARTQLVTDPENFAAWGATGTIAVTGGEVDPFGSNNAYLLNSNADLNDAIFQTVAFTTNATKAILCFIRLFNGAAQPAIGIDNSSVWKHRAKITWGAGGVPSLTTINGTGTLFSLIPWGSIGWYAVAIGVDSVVAAETNRYFLFPDVSGGLAGTYFFGANAWNAPFPSSYQGPSGGASPSVASLLTVPFNWGTSRDVSVLTRVARPVWVAASGDIGGDKYAWELSTAVAKLALHGKTATRDWRSIIDTSATDSTVDTAIPAGAELRLLSQFKTLVAGGQVAQDVGSGISGFGGAASAAAAYGNQTLRIGGGSGTEFDGVLLDALFVDGQHTKAEMEAVP